MDDGQRSIELTWSSDGELASVWAITGDLICELSRLSTPRKSGRICFNNLI